MSNEKQQPSGGTNLSNEYLYNACSLLRRYKKNFAEIEVIFSKLMQF